MNFFENQDAARRNTRIMVALYLLAVVDVVLAVDLLLGVAYLRVSDLGLRPGTGLFAMFFAVLGSVYAWGAIATTGLIFSVSVVRIWKLAEGGTMVAAMIGARAVSPSTRDPLEKRLLNVVEEMAIASGVRVPKVYVMDEEKGINAFAAGYNVSNAVVAVTRGTLETLSRDELQGVIGHEFSHILNGDMWLNINMIGVLSGIVFIGGIGSFLMRVSRRSDGKSAGGGFALGLALFLIGYIGVFFARMIKAAVSRQREFLADAASVQFTRNPDGIAGALDQIRASGRGALIDNRHAEDMSHMFFGQGITVWISGLFATHPPIEDRIARVRPGFQPSRYRARRAAVAPSAEIGTQFGPVSALAGDSHGGPDPGSGNASSGQRVDDSGVAWGRSADDGAKMVGTLDAGRIDYAARLIARLPADLHSALHETSSAGAAILATLLAPRDEVLNAQLDAVRALGQEALAERAHTLMPQVRGLGTGYDLTLVDLALPAMKAATPEDKSQLLAALEAVIHADRRISLQEFVVLTLVKTQLAERARPAAGKGKPLAALRSDVVLVMSLMAQAGRGRGADPALDRAMADAFAAGAHIVGMSDAQLLHRDRLSLESAGLALERLMSVAPLAKAILVKALFTVVSADGTIRVLEAELMRLIGAVLDCPLPPMFEDIDPATLSA